MIAMLRRQQFAARSERFDPAQQALFEAACAESIAAVESELETLTPAAPISAVETPAPNRPRRQPLPADLPRVEQRIEPEACTCGTCGGALHCIGEEVSEKLDIKPVEFFVRRVVRPKYAYRRCETVVTAPTLPAVIERGIAEPGLLAHVAVSKYVDHQPLTRQQVICGRSGIDLPVSTQAEWMGAIGYALQPLVAVLRADLHGAAVIHADETPVQILSVGGSKAKGSKGGGSNGANKTRTGYLFAFHRGETDQPPIIVYDFAESRSGAHASRLLEQYAGALVVDDYAGYKALFAQADDAGKRRIRELACWAHARRKFFELHAANGSEIGAEALRRIGELYKVERDARALKPPERHTLRQAHAKPLLDAFHAWLIELRPTISEGSATANALDYVLRR